MGGDDEHVNKGEVEGEAVEFAVGRENFKLGG